MYSSIINKIPEALSIYFNQLVYDQKEKGVDVITLSLGEAYFDIPLYDFNKLNLEKCHHYSDSRGNYKLREIISNYYNSNYGAYVDPKNEILISAGSKPLIYMALLTILNKNEEVLVIEPAWLSYSEQIKLAGGKVKYVNYNKSVNEIIKLVSKKTKAIIVNNPNNPAGKHYSISELKKLISIAKKKNLWLIVDEAYSDFVEKQFYTSFKLVKNFSNIIVINSLSKNFGISGWRIGYAISNPEFIQKLLKLNQHLITCAPSILMNYLEIYFDDLIKITKPQIKKLISKRSKIKKVLTHSKLSFLGGDSTFYFFIRLDSYNGDVINFCLYLLLKYNIAVVPGQAYGKSTKKFIRMSIGTETEERIHDAIKTIVSLSRKKIDNKELHRLLKINNIKMFSYK
jgi:aspartate aminotransferase/aminotransferase